MVDKRTIQADFVATGVDQFKTVEQYLKRAKQEMEALNKLTSGFKKELTQIQNQTKNLQKRIGLEQPLNRATKQLQGGGAEAEIINANTRAINNQKKAQKDLEIQTLATQRQQLRGDESRLELLKKLEAQERRVIQLRTGGSNPDNLRGAARASKLRAEERALRNIQVATEAATAAEAKRNRQLKITESIQRSIQSGRARNQSEELMQISREHAIKRTTGDGGAALFQIQGQLLGNYLVMNKIFQLFSFGSQFVLQLDQAFRQLQAITGTTETEMSTLREELIAVSEQTKFTAVEVAEAATVLGQAGFSTTQIKQSIQDVTFLATAVGTDLKSAVDVTTSTLSIFNMRADQTGHVANVLTGAINNSKLTLDKLTLGLQYAGNTAAQAGATFEETVSILGAAANAGIRSGSTLGTGLRQFLVGLLNPTEKMKKELQDLGLTLEDVDVKSKGLVNVFQTLKDAGFGASQAFSGMQVRAAAAFLAVSNNLDVARDLEQSLLLTNAAAEANAVQMRGLANSLDVFKSVLGTFITRLSEPFKNFLIDTVKAVGELLKAISNLGMVLPVVGTALIGLVGGAILTRLFKLITGVIKFRVSMTALAAGVASVGTTASASAIGVRTLNVALAALGGWPGILITGFTTAAAVMSQFGNTSVNTARRLDQFQANVDAVAGKLQTTESNIESIDETIDRLNDRYTELSQNQRALDTEILKADVSFGKLGLRLDSSVDTVEELSKALVELRQRLLEVKQIDLDNLNIEQSVSIQEQLRALVGKNEDTGFKVGAVDKFFLGNLRTPPELAGTRFKNVSDIRKRSIGINSDLEELSNLSFSQLADEDLEEAKKSMIEFRRQLVANQVELQAEIERLRSEGVDVSPAEIVRASLSEQVAAIDKGTADIITLQTTKTRQLFTRFARTDLSKGFESFLDEEAKKIAQIQEKLSEAGSDPISRKTAVQDFVKPIEDIQKTAEKAIRERITKTALGAELAMEITDEQYEGFIKSLEPRVAAIFSEQGNLVKSTVEGAEKMILETAEAQLKLIEKQGKLLNEKLQLAETGAEVNSLSAKIKENIAAAHQKEAEIIGIKLQQANGLDEISNLDIERQLNDISKENDLEKLSQSVRNFRGKLVNVAEELQEDSDELEEIRNKASQATRKQDLAIARLQSQIDANQTGGPLAGRYDSTEIKIFEQQIKDLEFDRLRTELEALRTRQEETQALIDERQADFEAKRARLGVSAKDNDPALKEAKEAQKKLNDAREEGKQIAEDLAMKEAVLAGKMVETADATKGTTFIIKESIRQWSEENSKFDIGETIKGQMDTASQAFGNFVTESTRGTKTVAESFRGMAISILESLQEMAAQYAAKSLFSMILGQGVVGPTGPQQPSGLFGLFANDGMNYVRAANGFTPNQNRDSVPILARPGEAILRNSAVQMIGRDNIATMNALGNRKISKGVSPMSFDKEGGGDTVNVYVVSEDQKPQMGPNDVIVTITEDLANGGPTKKLVKSIQMGKI